MTGHFDRVGELFHELCDLDAEVLAKRLAEVARDEPEVHGALLELLAKDKGSDPRLERPAIDFVSAEGERSFFRRTRGHLPEPESGLAPGKEVGEFRLVSLLGQGGMGQVWEAEQVSLKRRVALKFMRPGHVTEKQLELFAREARAGGRLSHPGIVAVYGHGQSDGLSWIALELVGGAWTLRDFLDEAARAETLPTGYDRHAAQLVAEIADAMQAAHEAGVIHRDLKPQNVLVTPDDHPKVTDFGLARITDESALTRSGDLAGTYYYMSPEQVAAKRAGIDHRTDIFSLGIVLYELLTLRRPFQGDTSHQVAAQILAKDPPDPRTIRSRVPRDLAVIVGKALEKDRDGRFQTMKEFAADLRRHLADEPIHATPPTQIDRAVKWVKRNPGKSSAASILAVTFTVIAVLLVANVRTNRALATKTTEAEASAREALDNARAARANEDRAEREAARRADEVRRLSALQDLEGLLANEDELWPALPDNIIAYEGWINDARRLVTDLPNHRSERSKLRRVALPQTAEERRAERESHPDYPRWVELKGQLLIAAEAAAAASSDKEIPLAQARLAALEEECTVLGGRLDERRTWSFPEEEREARWWNNQLTRLIEGLEELERELISKDGMTEGHGWSIPKRLEIARSLEAGFRLDGEQARAWSEALPEIRSAYPGLTLVPQLGLVPLGPDSDSGLWEFAYLPTGETPSRNAQGDLEFKSKTAVVLVLLPGGSAWLGTQTTEAKGTNYFNSNPDAFNGQPPREVHLDPFFISKFEMTTHQWLQFVGKDPSRTDSSDATLPLENVSWNEASLWLPRMGLALPSEEQWEYAARAGTTTPWWTGVDESSLTGQVNTAIRSLPDPYPGIAPVTALAPNPFGLYNVAGNVWEWCRDLVQRDLPEKQQTLTNAVCRGGGFSVPFSYFVASACRDERPPVLVNNSIGVRPTRPIIPGPR